MFVQSSAIEYMTGELLARICDVLEMQINFTLFQHEYLYKFQLNRTRGVIVSVQYRGFESRSGQTKDCKICFCYLA